MRQWLRGRAADRYIGTDYKSQLSPYDTIYSFGTLWNGKYGVCGEGGKADRITVQTGESEGDVVITDPYETGIKKDSRIQAKS